VQRGTNMDNIPTTVTTQAISLTAGLIPLVHDYTQGETLEILAIKYNISETEVSEFLNRKEVKQFISTSLANHGYVAKKQRIDLLNRIVEQKIQESEDNELSLSNKDLIEVLKLLKDEGKDLTVAENEQDSGKAQYIQIINSLKAD